MHIIPETGKLDISLFQIRYGLTISERYSFQEGQELKSLFGNKQTL